MMDTNEDEELARILQRADKHNKRTAEILRQLEAGSSNRERLEAQRARLQEMRKQVDALREPRSHKPDNTKEGGLTKWIGGIIATIIAGAVLAVIGPMLLQGEYNPFIHPSVKILNFPGFIELVPNEEKTIQIDVYNEGKTSAEQCDIYIEAGHISNSEPKPYIIVYPKWPQLHTSSETFGAEPGSKRTVDMRLLWVETNPQKYNYDISARVSCANYKSVYSHSYISLVRQ